MAGRTRPPWRSFPHQNFPTAPARVRRADLGHAGRSACHATRHPSSERVVLAAAQVGIFVSICVTTGCNRFNVTISMTN